MKEEISQQRCTIGAHWYTNFLPESRASKTNVDVVDKKVNSETKLSTREVCVPHGHPITRPEGAKRIDHFRVTFGLFFKASLGAHPFI